MGRHVPTARSEEKVSKRRLLVTGAAAIAALSLGVVSVPQAGHAAPAGRGVTTAPTPPPVPVVKMKAPKHLSGATAPRGLSLANGAPVHTYTVNSLNDVAGDGVAGVCETAAGNGVCTLRAAIMATNTDETTDKVVVPAGTFNLAIPAGGATDGAVGPLKLEDTGGIILWGAGDGLSGTIINGYAASGGAISCVSSEMVLPSGSKKRLAASPNEEEDRA